MITLIGSSNMRGGHLDGGKIDEDLFIKNQLSSVLSTPVTSMASPGNGNELYIDNMIYAKKKYNTKIFIVEIWFSRVFQTMLLPNQFMIEQAKNTDISSLYTETTENIYENCRVNVVNYSERDDRKFRTETTIGFHLPFKKIVELNCMVLPIRNCDYLHMNLQIKKMINSVNSFCELTDSHVLWQFHHDFLFKELKDFIFDYITKESLINSAINFLGLHSWGSQRGYICDDKEHLSGEGDRVYVNEILAPFVKKYCTNNSITI